MRSLLAIMTAFAITGCRSPATKCAHTQETGFSEGLAVVSVKENEERYKLGYLKRGYMDEKGKVVIPIIYDYALPFSEGLAVVGICTWLPSGGNGWKCGYIDRTGKVVFPIRYDWAKSFSNGWAPVMVKQKWGFIDKTGTVVMEPQFDSLSDFSEDLAPAMLHGKWGYIDRTGIFVIEPQYDYAFGFSDGKAQVLMRDPSYIGSGDGVTVGGLKGIIDKDGRFISKPTK